MVCTLKNKYLKFSVFILSVTASLASSSLLALTNAEATDQAVRLFVRINGVRPSSAMVATLRTHLLNNRADIAAFAAMDDVNQSFYKLTLPEMFSKWRGPDAEASADLNDFSASLVGLVINNQRFDEIVYGDVIYAAPLDVTDFTVLVPGEGGTTMPVPVRMNGNPFIRIAGTIYNTAEYPFPPAGKVVPILRARNATEYRYVDSLHYQQMQSSMPDWPSRLTRFSQTQVFSNITSGAPIFQLNSNSVAGALTLKTVGEAYFNAGTNRRPIRWIFEKLLGRSLESMQDASLPDNFVRRDIDRAPGGNAATYQNSCRSCHAGMDAFMNVFTPYDFNLTGNTSTSYRLTNLNVSGFKIFRQFNTFPQGFLPTVENATTWTNLWTLGMNANLGWRLPSGVSSITSGTGVNSLMRVIAATEAFGNNLVRVGFEKVCGRSPIADESALLQQMARQFEVGFPSYSSFSASGPYNFRALMARMAPFCFGGNL